MSHPTQRAGRQAALAPSAALPVPVHVHHAPHAALLIDFDNVTLGIRSDLTKELRTLLNSDIIKGKVAVQRAYADWRRYPQYIVPLSESSIDLIFAPAFGTNKKNATDIRLAVDATELVFTRPEIGTFILLSGDSDFSSLVIKLKEYGKYVIGVGIRESASDLLIQNCDEYFSYSDLAGLTKEADLPSAQRDPWQLVVEAVQQMGRNGDVMRSDRLKQVMQQIDSNFDERNAGFNRFSKFVTVAADKGLIRVTKLENGQYEVAPIAAAAPAAAPKREAPAKRGAERERAPAEEGGRGRRGRGRGRGGRPRPEEGAREKPSEARTPVSMANGTLSLASAFQLLTRAMAELPSPVGGEAVRARMAALHGRVDPLLDPTRFGRFLRQANDAEIADVRKLDDETLEVSPHKADLGLTRAIAARTETAAPVAETNGSAAAGAPADAARRGSAALRFRRGSRAPSRPLDLPLVGVVRVDDDLPTHAPVEAAAEVPKSPARKRGRGAKPAGDDTAKDSGAEPKKAPRSRAKKSG